jgi:ATP-dependent DNA helicase DinG
MSKWDEQFAPVLAQGREVREGQRTLGNAIIDVVEKGGNLIAEASTGTGKSFATLVPVIVAVQKAKKKKETYRGVVSTETLTLQDQIFKKDLPFLATLYKDFTYGKLMGRSNYLCFEVAKDNAIGVKELDALVTLLETRSTNLGDGEKSDVERVIGRKLDKEEWSKIAGSSTFCGENKCSPDVCYGAKARKVAKEVDILVVNHAVLATDLEIRSNALPESGAEDGLVGTFETLIVDEAHELAPVLVENGTKEVSLWELSAMGSTIIAGIEHAQLVLANASIGRIASETVDDIIDAFNSIQNFYVLLAEKAGEKWTNYSTAVCIKNLMMGQPQYIIHAMDVYEQQVPKLLEDALESIERIQKYLTKGVAVAFEEKLKKRVKISKALRTAGDLAGNVRILLAAMQTKDGIISEYGIYGVTIRGWEKKKDGSKGMTMRLKPMDVSGRAQYLFHNKTNIFVSATLTDLTDGTFKYVKASTGFPSGAKELRVSTPFDLATQQMFYMTPATGTKVAHLRGAQFDFDELVDLIHAARGRSLVLFTSREELDWASDAVKVLQAQGVFPYDILVQERDADKAELMEKFKSDTHSVLFATKSFFVGIDVPGEALSAVWICKWPNPQYNAECKQQVIYWGGRGFKKWYERESLTTFQQGAGRLIRSSGCKGVVGVLDFRVSDRKESVFKSALTGVQAIGSPVTIKIDDVKTFLA